MESEYKGSSNQFVESGMTNGREKEYLGVGEKRKLRGWGLLLRVAAAVLSLAAAVVLAFDKQTATVEIKLVATLPPVTVPVTAKWYYLSAFVYFVGANAIASSYGVISLVLMLMSRVGKQRIVRMIVVLDVVMVALLFSSFGAAVAIGVIGHEGNSHLQWQKVCNVFDKFCHQGAAALLLSGGASFVFISLVSISILNLHKINS